MCLELLEYNTVGWSSWRPVYQKNSGKLESSRDEVDCCRSRRSWDRMDTGVERYPNGSTDQTKAEVRMKISGYKKGYSQRRGRRVGGHERLRWGLEDLFLLLGAENPDKRTMIVEVATLPIVAEGRRTDFVCHLRTF